MELRGRYHQLRKSIYRFAWLATKLFLYLVRGILLDSIYFFRGESNKGDYLCDNICSALIKYHLILIYFVSPYKQVEH